MPTSKESHISCKMVSISAAQVHSTSANFPPMVDQIISMRLKSLGFTGHLGSIRINRGRISIVTRA